MPRQDSPKGFRVLGKRWELRVTVVDRFNAPMDLTGCTVTAAIGAGLDGSLPYLSKSGSVASPNADIVFADQNSAPGQVSIAFLPAETGAFPWPNTGQLFYQVDIRVDATHMDAGAEGWIVVRRSLF